MKWKKRMKNNKLKDLEKVEVEKIKGDDEEKKWIKKNMKRKKRVMIFIRGLKNKLED